MLWRVLNFQGVRWYADVVRVPSSALQVRKACVVKALRPDRLPEALVEVVESVLGSRPNIRAP